MATSIQVSGKLKSTLASRKISEKESYERVIWDLLEDSMELTEETRKDILEARKEVQKGNFKTISQVKKELGL